jgi:hypothetical protein
MKADSYNEQKGPWRLEEEVRRRRLREDARRPTSVNLAETIALSESVSSFAGSAWKAPRAGEG